MLDHVSIAVSDIRRSIAFYEQALAPLGLRCLKSYGDANEVPHHVGFASGQKPYLWLGNGDPIKGYVPIAPGAPDRASVDAFHEAATAAGGIDNGTPGLRPHYHASYCSAFVLDPDGCNLEAVHHGF